jgi:hypothetical protein
MAPQREILTDAGSRAKNRRVCSLMNGFPMKVMRKVMRHQSREINCQYCSCAHLSTNAIQRFIREVCFQFRRLTSCAGRTEHDAHRWAQIALLTNRR